MLHCNCKEWRIKMRTHEPRDIKILRPDSKGRVHLGVLAKGISGYKMTVDEKTHTITLDPYAEIPLAEKWLFENSKAVESIKRGLKDAAENRLVDRGSFAEHIIEED